MTNARGRLLLLAGGVLLVTWAMTGSAKDDPPAGKSKAMALLPGVKKHLDAEYADLEKLYKDLHTNPELSLQEVRTSARMARELLKLGFDVTTKFGATGVVGVLKNGKGPTILVRTDMDALPVTEATGRPYASKARARDRNGNEVGVMHACGHDIHMTCWVGVARVLTALKTQWKGTLLFIAQPAEEIGTGARLMMEAGLFDRFGKPDYCLALHADSLREAGTIGYTEGLAMANVDSVDVIVKGKGGHGAAPHTAVDPVVLAARIVLDLQTLVSRETNPVDPAVITVGSIHGGTKHNIIPDEVKLQITVRSTKDSVRKHLLDGIKRVAEGCAKAANAPPPVVKVDLSEFTPALHNDVELTRRTVAVLKEVLGEKNVVTRLPMMGGEDFSRFSAGKTPVFLYFLGTIDSARFAAAKKEGKELPSMHSPLYWPTPEPSIRVGVTTMSMAVLNLLGQ